MGSRGRSRADARWALALFDACPGWLDDSELTRELAEEWSLRHPDAAPDAVRDPGLIRFLFERRLAARVELDRRRLTWMAAFWQASGATISPACANRRGRAVRAQNLVPGSSFFTALAVRSLAAAIGRRSVRDVPAGPASAASARDAEQANLNLDFETQRPRSRPASRTPRPAIGSGPHFFLPAAFAAGFFSVPFFAFSLSFGALSPMISLPRDG